VVDALAVSSDVFFYKIGEEIFSERGNRPVLEEEVRQFGFGAPTEIDLPYEFVGTVPGKDLKKRLAAAGAITADEGRGYYVGDNVQFSIGQGLMSATPLQMAVAYSTLANGGLVLRPKVVRAIWTPGTPTTKSGRLNFAAGVLSKDLSDAFVTRDMNMPAEIRDPIVEGLTRVINGPGVRSDIYHSTTGERLFKSYPKNVLPIAGKTGTAQGFGNLPWNDSSAFGAFSKNPDKPYTVYAYLEKSGYGSRAAAPVVKCIFTALAERTRVDPAVPADPLDRSSVAPATSQSLTNPLCLVGSGSTVRD